jgi:hypothetical protein
MEKEKPNEKPKEEPKEQEKKKKPGRKRKSVETIQIVKELVVLSFE